MRRELSRRQRLPWRWGTVGLILTLLLSWTGFDTAYAHLAVVQAKRLTVRDKPAVQLLIQTDQGAGKEIIVQVGANKITFQTDSRGRVDTGHLEIPSGATAVSVHMPKPGDELWPSTCQIPLDQIPQNEFRRVEACMDLEPPRTRFLQTPPKNSFGWNKAPVTVTLEASDAKSGVKQICYELQGAITQGVRCTAGARVSFSLPSSPNGVTTVRFFAEDNWVNKGEGPPGPNREPVQQEAVRIDTGAPTVTLRGLASPFPQGGPASISWEITDSVSGVDPSSCSVTIAPPGTTSTQTLSTACSGQASLSAERYGEGTATVRVFARDRAGNEGSDSLRIELRRFRQPPRADFRCSPTQGPPPLTVSCQDRSSGEITSWSWDWGDGTTSSERNPSHTYTRSGVYTITLTVGGPGGRDQKSFCCIEVLRTGDVRVTLLWSSTADLDLHVIDPNGCMVFWDNPSCPSGGQLDVDANADCEDVTTKPVENIFWPTGQAPRGEYQVYVNYFEQCSGSSSTESFTVRILVDGETREFNMNISCCGKPVLVTTFRR